MNSIVCMDNTILKIVQIFCIRTASAADEHEFSRRASRCRGQSAASVRAPLLTRLSLLRQGEKVYQLDDYLALELSLSWSKSTQWYSQRSR